MQNLVDTHRKNIETAGAALAKAVIDATRAHSEAVTASATAFDAAVAKKIEEFYGPGRAQREGNKAIEDAIGKTAAEAMQAHWDETHSGGGGTGSGEESLP